MTNLVKRNENGKPVTTSLLVAEKFEKRHSDVIRSIERSISTDAKLRSFYVPTNYTDEKGEDRPMYIMNRDGFSLLAMGFTGEKALKFKLEFIDAFNTMEKMLQSDEFILLRSREILEQKINVLEAKSEAQEKLIKEIAPKAEYYDKTLASSDTITTTQIAKELGLSAITLNRKLHDLDIQYKVNGQWVLYSKYQNKGYTKPYTYTEIIDEESRTFISTVWTQKGRRFIHEILEKTDSKKIISFQSININPEMN